MITLVPRIEIPTQAPALYLKAGGGSVQTYTPGGRYSPSSITHYRTQTRPLDPADPRAVALIEHWASLPGDVAYRVRTRLPRV